MIKQSIKASERICFPQFDTKFPTKQQRITKIGTILWESMSSQILQKQTSQGKGQMLQSTGWLSCMDHYVLPVKIQTDMQWWDSVGNVWLIFPVVILGHKMSGSVFTLM